MGSEWAVGSASELALWMGCDSDCRTAISTVSCSDFWMAHEMAYQCWVIEKAS